MPTDITLCHTVSSIAYGEKADGYTATFSSDFVTPSTSKRILYCAWADHITLANYLINANNVTVGSIDIVVGATHPNYTNQFVSSLTITPVTPVATAEATYVYAQLEVCYKSSPFNPASPALLREDTVSLSTSVVPLAQQSVTFADDSQASNDAEQTITYINYKVTLKQVKTIPEAAVINCINKISSTNMTFKIGSAGAGHTIPAGQVLYNGIEDIKIGYAATGSQRFDVTHNFLISPVNLNYEYNPANTGADAFSRFETVTPAKYLTADFSTLGV